MHLSPSHAHDTHKCGCTSKQHHIHITPNDSTPSDPTKKKGTGTVTSQYTTFTTSNMMAMVWSIYCLYGYRMHTCKLHLRRLRHFPGKRADIAENILEGRCLGMNFTHWHSFVLTCALTTCYRSASICSDIWTWLFNLTRYGHELQHLQLPENRAGEEQRWEGSLIENIREWILDTAKCLTFTSTHNSSLLSWLNYSWNSFYGLFLSTYMYRFARAQKTCTLPMSSAHICVAEANFD